MNSFIFLVASLIFQILLDANTALGQSITLLDDVVVSWSNTQFDTTFTVVSTLGADIDVEDCWVGVAFNNLPQMSGSNAVVCRNAPSGSISSVNTYLNGNGNSNLLDSTNPNIGISNAFISVSQGYLSCQFTRSNTVNFSGYYKINQTNIPYILVAYGPGDLSYHYSNRAVSATRINVYPTTTTTRTSTTTTTTTSTTTTAPTSTTRVTNSTSSVTTSSNVTSSNMTTTSTTRVNSNTTTSAKWTRTSTPKYEPLVINILRLIEYWLSSRFN